VSKASGLEPLSLIRKHSPKQGRAITTRHLLMSHRRGSMTHMTLRTNCYERKRKLLVFVTKPQHLRFCRTNHQSKEVPAFRRDPNRWHSVVRSPSRARRYFFFFTAAFLTGGFFAGTGFLVVAVTACFVVTGALVAAGATTGPLTAGSETLPEL
jgi:hypothetical protein